MATVFDTAMQTPDIVLQSDMRSQRVGSNQLMCQWRVRRLKVY